MSLTKNEIKFIKSLQLKKQRDLNKLFIVEGEKVILELLSQSKFKINALYYTADYNTENISENINSTLIPSKTLERITGFKKANKALAVVNFNTINQPDTKEDNLILLLDDINDPGNLGTIIRTADWFGVTQIISSKNTVDLYNPKVIQSSMGAIFRINYFVKDLMTTIKDLKNDNFQISGATIEGGNVYNNTPPLKTALIMGSESHGIQDNILSLLDERVSIPNFGKSESLNVSMATGILLSEYKRSTLQK